MARRKLLEVAKSWVPDSKHPAASQPTPFGLNRYIMLAIHMGYTFASTYVYLGWGPLSAMLFRHKVFLWKCTSEEQALATSFNSAVCKSQDISVQGLFTITYAAHYSFCAVAGLLTDTAGPKVTAILGQALNVCGWTILGACTDSFRAVLPAFLLIGSAAGMSYLPMLCVIHLFPGSTGFGLTIMGAACSLGFAVSLLMNSVNQVGIAFEWVIWGYVLIGPVMSMGIIILFVPLNGYIEVDRFVLVHQVKSPIPSATSPATHRHAKALPQIHSSPYASASSYAQSPEEDEAALSSVTDDEFFLPFKKEACTFLYIGLCIYFCISSVVMNYYQKACGLFLSNEALRLLDIAMPLSIVPCIILGRVYAYFLAPNSRHDSRTPLTDPAFTTTSPQV